MNSNMEFHKIKVAEKSINCLFRFPKTLNYFRQYHVANINKPDQVVAVTETAFSDWKSAGNMKDAFGEFCLLCQPISEALMEYDCCVFHAAALRYHDQAILIAGGSGAGKSTHTRLLLERYPDEFTVINGDKPVLECINSGIIVHPSPWNGKEGLHGEEPAPLSCLFLLQRDTVDTISLCTEKEAAVFAFPMVFQSFETETIIRSAGAITERIVQGTTCFRFQSNNIEESSDLLYQSIKEVVDNGI